MSRFPTYISGLIFQKQEIRWSWLIVAIFVGFTSLGKTQDIDLTLDEAISIAQERSILQKKSAQDLLNTSNQLEILNSGFKPQLALNANLPNFYKSTSAVIQPDGSINFQPISQDNSLLNLQLSQKLLPTNTTIFAEANLQRYQDFTDDYSRYNAIPFRLGIIQPLHRVNYDKWNQRFYEMDLHIAEKRLTVVHAKIATEVTAAFFQVLMAQIDRQIATTNKENNQNLYEIALERYALGKISKSDLLQLELGLTNAAQNEIKSSRALIRSTALLKETMNRNLHTDDIPTVVTPEIPEILPIDPDEAAELAWEHRPEQLEYQKLMLEAEQAIEIADRENGWNAELKAQIGFTGSGNTLQDSYAQSNFEALAQVGIYVPILDGGKRKLSMADAKSSYTYYEVEKEYTELTFKQNVRQLVLQFNQLQKEAELARRSYEIAGQRYEIVNQRYILDDISITDLTLAFGERDQAWRNHISLLQAYWITYYTIRQLTLHHFQ